MFNLASACTFDGHMDNKWHIGVSWTMLNDVLTKGLMTNILENLETKLCRVNFSGLNLYEGDNLGTKLSIYSKKFIEGNERLHLYLVGIGKLTWN